MEKSKSQISPFAITARCLGHPKKLHTPIVVANFQAEDDGIIAARVNAMWDTGADVCLISRSLASLLGIDFRKIIRAESVTGPVSSAIGYTHISLVSNGDVIPVLTEIVEEASPTGDYSFIIGMDLISRGTLAVTSSKLDTTLSFIIPATVPIDFTEATQGNKAYIPLSSVKEIIRPAHGKDAIELITESC